MLIKEEEEIVKMIKSFQFSVLFQYYFGQTAKIEVTGYTNNMVTCGDWKICRLQNES